MLESTQSHVLRKWGEFSEDNLSHLRWALTQEWRNRSQQSHKASTELVPPDWHLENLKNEKFMDHREQFLERNFVRGILGKRKEKSMSLCYLEWVSGNGPSELFAQRLFLAETGVRYGEGTGPAMRCLDDSHSPHILRYSFQAVMFSKRKRWQTSFWQEQNWWEQAFFQLLVRSGVCQFSRSLP